MSDSITNVDADAEADGSISGLLAIVNGNLLLYLHRAAHRSVDAIEHDQQEVAAGLDDPAAMLLDGRIN